MRARICLGLLFVLYAVPASAVPVSIVPSAANVTAGSTFSLDIATADVVDLFGFEFDFGFNPAFFSAIDISEGLFLSSAGTTVFVPGVIDNTIGTISFTGSSLVGAIAGASGSGVLATVTFTALAPVIASQITISNVTLLDSSFGVIASTIENGSITVNAPTSVPEPSTLLCMAAGLVGVWRRRKS